MVTFDVSTDLNMANRARGHMVDIVLNEKGKLLAGRTHCVIAVPSCLYPVSMNRMKASALDRLEPDVLPVAPLTRTFVVAAANGKRGVISRQQLCIPAYTFTNSCPSSENRMLHGRIGTPPSGPLRCICSAILQPRKG